MSYLYAHQDTVPAFHRSKLCGCRSGAASRRCCSQKAHSMHHSDRQDRIKAPNAGHQVTSFYCLPSHSTLLPLLGSCKRSSSSKGKGPARARARAWRTWQPSLEGLHLDPVSFLLTYSTYSLPYFTLNKAYLHPHSLQSVSTSLESVSLQSFHAQTYLHLATRQTNASTFIVRLPTPY